MIHQDHFRSPKFTHLYTHTVSSELFSMRSKLLAVLKVDKHSFACLLGDLLIRVHGFHFSVPDPGVQERRRRLDVRAVEFGCLPSQECEATLSVHLTAIEIITGQLKPKTKYANFKTRAEKKDHLTLT